MPKIARPGTKQVNMDMPIEVLEQARAFAKSRNEPFIDVVVAALKRHMASPPPLPHEVPLPPAPPMPQLQAVAPVSSVALAADLVPAAGTEPDPTVRPVSERRMLFEAMRANSMTDDNAFLVYADFVQERDNDEHTANRIREVVAQTSAAIRGDDDDAKQRAADSRGYLLRGVDAMLDRERKDGKTAAHFRRTADVLLKPSSNGIPRGKPPAQPATATMQAPAPEPAPKKAKGKRK